MSRSSGLEGGAPNRTRSVDASFGVAALSNPAKRFDEQFGLQALPLDPLVLMTKVADLKAVLTAA